MNYIFVKNVISSWTTLVFLKLTQNSVIEETMQFFQIFNKNWKFLFIWTSYTFIAPLLQLTGRFQNILLAITRKQSISELMFI